ncbi:hypothetical protein ACFLS1_04890 [Verrucomicrobiota bacterium]
MKTSINWIIALTLLLSVSYTAISKEKTRFTKEIKNTDPEADTKKYGKEFSRLYTKPNPDCSGGITGILPISRDAVDIVLAMPISEPKLCYKAEIPSSGASFLFKGLPSAKYDLIVICKKNVYEGLSLHPEKSTLKSSDLKNMQKHLDESEPFYPLKKMNRIQGSTGHMKGTAQAFITFIRNKRSMDYGYRMYDSHRRRFVRAKLDQVGPGWQMSMVRVLYTEFVKPGDYFVPVKYCESLNCIRVARSIKDLGKIKL